jgi:hypothetical protein
MRTSLFCALLAAFLTSGCDDPPTDGDAGREPSHDAGSSDAGAHDASTSDAAPSADAATPGDCDTRTGGAFISFAVGDESLRVWSTNDAFIDAAIANMASDTRQNAVFGTILAGADCEPEHAWHLDPEDMSFADFSVEVCDGRPSDLDNDLAYWMDTVMQYCPWGPMITAIDDRR